MLLARWTRIEQISNPELLQPTSETSAELIDIAQALEQLGRDTSLKEAERRELLAVERALAKMATGSFGVCEDCGDEIPPKRLMVLPEARLCAQCQAFEERQSAKMSPKTRAAG
jgi:DnaK suppressor protein